MIKNHLRLGAIFMFLIIRCSTTGMENNLVKRGCDGIIGSELRKDRCGVCGGEEESCTYIEGLFRSRNLENDYQVVVRIPAGARRINITETNRSRSCLALRSADRNGKFYINGELKSGIIDPAKFYRVGESDFGYQRPFRSNKGESIVAEGPTNIELVVLLYFQGENPGIHYEYTIPKSSPDRRQTANRFASNQNDVEFLNHDENNDIELPTFENAADDYRDASFSRQPLRRQENGKTFRNRLRWLNLAQGGISAQNLLETVEENWRLRHNRHFRLFGRNRANPRRDAIWANSLTEGNERIAVWRRRGYGPCSKSCAEGIKTSIIRCVATDSNHEVSEGQCSGSKPRIIRKRCNRQACPAYYDVGLWSPCTRTCGIGRRTRSVLCRQMFAQNFTTVVSHRKCRSRILPELTEKCQVGECPHWEAFQNWSECNVKCGFGTQARRVVCRLSNGKIISDNRCPRMQKPISTRPCDAGPCVTRWYVTDWEQCSADCSQGVQKRTVYCLNTAASLVGCSARHEPSSTRTCGRGSCETKYQWFAGEWGKCSRECGGGYQKRKVICLSQSLSGSVRLGEEVNTRLLCEDRKKPAIRQLCNTQSCGARWHYTAWSECSVTCGGGTRTRDVQCLNEDGEYCSSCNLKAKPEPTERCNTINCLALNGSDCKDRLTSCHLVLQAHFCTYAYYRRMCCSTCGRSTRVSNRLVLSTRSRRHS